MARAELVNLGEGLAGRIAPGDQRTQAGERVLWIHGYTLDSSSWTELWELLPGWYHVGIDLPGHGASLPLDPGENLPRLARRLVAMARRQRVRHLVALSFGTLVALQMAIEAPDEFASITLAAPALGGGPQASEIAECYAELMRLYRERGFGPHLRERWMRSPPDLFKGAESQPELWQKLWLLVGRHPWWELRDGSFSQLGNHPQTAAELQRIRAAILVLVGEREFPAFRRCAELIRRSVPGCRRVYLPEAGHLCLLEAPAAALEALASHLRAGAAVPV